MITDLLKWVTPGLAAVLGGVVLAVSVSPGNFAVALEISENGAFDAQAVPSAPPRNLEIAQANTGRSAPSSSITVLGPPRIADYWVSATRQPGGVIVFDGYAPDDATRQVFAGIEGADITWLKLGSGAPQAYRPAVDFGIDALAHLSEGRFALHGNTVTLSGIARSRADYEALTAMIETSLPEGLIVAQNEIVAPAVAVIAEPKPVPPGKPAATPPSVEPATPPPATAEPVQPAEKTKPVEQAAPPAIDPAYGFRASRIGGAVITMSGQVPADPALRYFGVVADAPTTGLTIAKGAPEDFIVSAIAGLRALSTMPDGTLAFAGGRWTLAGKSADAAVRDAILASIAALPSGPDWALDVTAPPAIEICRASLADFSARNAILFQSGAAVIAAESEPALDELALDLAACPDDVVHIEGYTDADGDDQLNLALSVARAEAVVGALIARSITPARLYAVGYGESTPIADNDTAAGKRLNRRIVVKVLDEHY